ncbi:MAG: hypothetical protein IJF23_06520, partial [Clostridia bacterium]|nr:hypothetical protein [Clostridia bacterium]
AGSARLFTQLRYTPMILCFILPLFAALPFAVPEKFIGALLDPRIFRPLHLHRHRLICRRQRSSVHPTALHPDDIMFYFAVVRGASVCGTRKIHRRVA